VKTKRPSYFQRAQKRRYESRPLRNPYFRPKERPKWLPWLLVIPASVLVVGGAGGLLSAPALALSPGNAEGLETVAWAEVEETVRDYLDEPWLYFAHRSNRFLFDEGELERRLMERFPFERAAVERRGRRVDVRVRERQTELLWLSGTDAWLVDREGHAIRALTPDERLYADDPSRAPPPEMEAAAARMRRLNRFVDVNRTPVAEGDRVLPPAEVEGALAFQQQLLALAIPFVSTAVDRVAGQRMVVRTLAGYDVLFDPTADAAAQAGRLHVLLRQTIPDPKTLDYVDLRFGDHVYYK